MDCLRQHLNNFLFLVIDDIKKIYLPISLATTALYLPIFCLSILNHLILNISKWIITIPIVIYLLLIPTCQFIRTIPLFNTFIAIIAIYYAQKVCEWILIRRDEFQKWSFFDIQHELFYYRVYTQPVNIRKLNKIRKEIFFTGSIQYNKHLQSLIYISCNIIKYYLLLDFIIYLINQIFRTEFYEKYFLIRIFINQLSGWIVYLFLLINYEILRHILCFIFNRPLELIPDLFQQPYRAISPSDFWSRWHQIFKNTWLELIFKPISIFIRHHWPYLPKFVIYGISSMSVFLFSGVIHEYMVYITFNKFSGDQIKFFFLQGLAVLIEYAFKQKFNQFSIPNSISFLLTFIFNSITSGYFLKPWIPYFKGKQTLKYSLTDFILRNLFDNVTFVRKLKIDFSDNGLVSL